MKISPLFSFFCLLAIVVDVAAEYLRPNNETMKYPCDSCRCCPSYYQCSDAGGFACCPYDNTLCPQFNTCCYKGTTCGPANDDPVNHCFLTWP